jgi:restriction endonuclease S subunit
VNKVAVVQNANPRVIASANIIVVRFADDPKLWSNYVKIFLETPAGLHMLQSFQRGTTVMNINPTDLGEMQIPMLPKDEMEQLVEKYIQEQQIYHSSILRAKARWDEQKKSMYQKWQ